MTSTVSITDPATTDPTAFGSSVTSLFRDRLGLSSCSRNGNQVEIVTDLEQIISISGLPLAVRNGSTREMPYNRNGGMEINLIGVSHKAYQQ